MSDETAATTRWRDAHAPDLDDIQRLAEDAFARLPGAFRRLAGPVPIVVVDFADDEVLDSLEIENEFDLMGLYHGYPVGVEASVEVMTQVTRIELYRRPILHYWTEHDESLGHLVTHVLVHEIGHHFGLSDADMEAIEAAADADEPR